MFKKLFNYIQFQYFFWCFTNGKFLNKKQKGMFELCESQGSNIYKLYDRSNGVTTFITAYGAWKSYKGFKVGYITESYGKSMYYSSLYNLSCNSFSNSAGVFVSIKGGKDLVGVKFNCLLIDNENVIEDVYKNINSERKIQLDTK